METFKAGSLHLPAADGQIDFQQQAKADIESITKLLNLNLSENSINYLTTKYIAVAIDGKRRGKQKPKSTPTETLQYAREEILHQLKSVAAMGLSGTVELAENACFSPIDSTPEDADQAILLNLIRHLLDKGTPVALLTARPAFLFDGIVNMLLNARIINKKDIKDPIIISPAGTPQDKIERLYKIGNIDVIMVGTGSKPEAAAHYLEHKKIQAKLAVLLDDTIGNSEKFLELGKIKKGIKVSSACSGEPDKTEWQQTIQDCTKTLLPSKHNFLNYLLKMKDADQYYVDMTLSMLAYHEPQYRLFTQLLAQVVDCKDPATVMNVNNTLNELAEVTNNTLKIALLDERTALHRTIFNDATIPNKLYLYLLAMAVNNPEKIKALQCYIDISDKALAQHLMNPATKLYRSFVKEDTTAYTANDSHKYEPTDKDKNPLLTYLNDRGIMLNNKSGFFGCRTTTTGECVAKASQDNQAAKQAILSSLSPRSTG